MYSQQRQLYNQRRQLNIATFSKWQSKYYELKSEDTEKDHFKIY